MGQVMSNLKELEWFDGGENYGDIECSSLLHNYVVMPDTGGMVKVSYFALSGEHSNKYATGFATVDDAKTWCWNHYNEKMRPYVKPMPTWVDAKKQLPQVDVDTQFICAYDSALEPYVKVTYFDKSLNEFDYEHEGVLAWMPIPSFKESDCEDI